MNLIKRHSTIVKLQWLVWIAVLLIIFFSIFPEDGFNQAASITLVSITFYLVVIYGNITFLYPFFYERGHKVQYIIYVIILLIAAGLTRGYLILYLYNKYMPGSHQRMTVVMMLNFIIAGFLTFMLSFIFRIALAYFSLKQHSEKILVQKSQAELNLLKSQVQPHFLFNTLNNIYYEAYLEAPRTAKLIERLSDFMRYFVDESPKDLVYLTTEIAFLENYIALEKIRIRHEITINFVHDFKADLRIPPMLLMTFVENIFKHGIDKSNSENKIQLSLLQRDDYLIFKTQNAIHEKPADTETNGFGIMNLRMRLNLLYGPRFELNIDEIDNYFTALLEIPIS